MTTTSPHSDFKALIGQLQYVPVIIAEGVQGHRDRLERAAQETGTSIPPRRRENLTKTQYLLLRMSLVYGVAILEAMTKEYCRSRLESNPSTPPTPTQADEPKPLVWYYESLDNSILNKKNWAWLVTNWAKEVITIDYANQSQGTDKVQPVVDECCAFEHWHVLLRCCAMRNLEVHNGGIMNDRTHRYAPLCDIGTKPVLHQGLFFDLAIALNLLNDQLSHVFSYG